jgi:uncharacterized membrane protein
MEELILTLIKIGEIMGHKRKNFDRIERRKLALEQKKKTQKTIIVVMVCLAIIVSVAVFFMTRNDSNDIIQKTESESEQPQLPDTGNEIRIALSKITTDANFYTYDADGTTVKYFAIKGSDGNVHVAFDACDVCYGAKKGYTKSGSDMQCINCGNRYAINGLGTENTRGGCWPSYLPMKIDGDDFLIQISDLEAKSWMF